MLLQSASLSLPGHLAVEPSRGPLFPGFALVTGPSRVADLRGAHYLAIQAHPSLASQVFICSGHRDMLFWSNPTQACLCENCQELLSSLEWVESTDPSVSHPGSIFPASLGVILQCKSPRWLAARGTMPAWQPADWRLLHAIIYIK